MTQLLSNAREEDRETCEAYARDCNDKIVAIWRVSDENKESVRKGLCCSHVICVVIGLISISVTVFFVTGSGGKASGEGTDFLPKILLSILLSLLPMVLCIGCMCMSQKSAKASMEGKVWALGEKNFYKMQTVNMGRLYQSGSDRAYCELSQINSITIDQAESGMFVCSGGTTAVKLHVQLGCAIADPLQANSRDNRSALLNPSCRVWCSDPNGAAKMIREAKEKYVKSGGGAPMVVVQMPGGAGGYPMMGQQNENYGTTTTSNPEDVSRKILALKQLLDAEAITQFEYDTKREDLMRQFH